MKLDIILQSHLLLNSHMLSNLITCLSNLGTIYDCVDKLFIVLYLYS